MVLIANHTRNDRRGQSFLLGCEAPWDPLRLTEAVCRRLFLWVPSGLCSLGAPSWGEAPSGAPPRVTLQDGTRAIHRTARPGCRLSVHPKAPARSSAPTMAARTGLDRSMRGAVPTPMGASGPGIPHEPPCLGGCMTRRTAHADAALSSECRANQVPHSNGDAGERIDV
jgi:hypothetical protein